MDPFYTDLRGDRPPGLSPEACRAALAANSGFFKGYSTGQLEIASRELPPESLKVLHLRYVENRSMRDIATILGKSSAMVRNHHNRGLFLLRKKAGLTLEAGGIG